MSFKVCLAGPEAFLPNSREQLDRKIALTATRPSADLAGGLCYPPRNRTNSSAGRAISGVDEKMVDSADAIIANLTPDRSVRRRRRDLLQARLPVRAGQAGLWVHEHSGQWIFDHCAGAVSIDATGLYARRGRAFRRGFRHERQQMPKGGIERRED